jgi:hypothetical protein
MKMILPLILILASPASVRAQAPPADVEGVSADCEACHKTVDPHTAVDNPKEMQNTADSYEVGVFGDKGGDASGDGSKTTK